MSFQIETLKEHNSGLVKLITQNLPDMLWVKDRDGTYIYANQALCHGLLMAKSTEEVVGKHDVYFADRERDTHPENPEWHTFGKLCFNSDQEVIDNDKSMKFEEFGNVKGKMLYLEVFKAPFYDKDNNILGTVGTGRDITELKMVQLALEEKNQEIQRLNEDLESSVQAEIKKRQDQETIMLHQSRQVVMGEMLESIAHQWRQPLNIIGLASAKLETEYQFFGFKEEDFLSTMALLSTNINLMSNTIDDFRKFLHPYKESSTFVPCTVIEETFYIFEAQFKACNIVNTYESTLKMGVKGIENEFKQVILILLNNAVDAIEENILKGNVKEGKIHIKIQQKDKNVLIEISDNGGGISKSIINKVFEAYYTTKGVSSGTGIGLYLAKNIIENRMKGSLSLKNIKDGCCFSISIPISINLD